jgi:hypothetical protein
MGNRHAPIPFKQEEQMSFDRTAVETVGGDWTEIEGLNNTLERLRNGRRQTIEPEGEFGPSKLAWKLGGFQQVILYRVVMLAEGCSTMWNARNVLGSILCARALMETTALISDFVSQLTALCKVRDFSSINNLVTNRTFGTRLEGWYGPDTNIQATNVLGHIDKLDKLADGARHHYDMLSEMCHPNALGHNFFFGDLDRTTATLTLSDTQCFNSHMLLRIIAAYGFLDFIESRLNQITRLLPTVIDISEDARQKPGT